MCAQTTLQSEAALRPVAITHGRAEHDEAQSLDVILRDRECGPGTRAPARAKAGTAERAKGGVVTAHVGHVLSFTYQNPRTGLFPGFSVNRQTARHPRVASLMLR